MIRLLCLIMISTIVQAGELSSPDGTPLTVADLRTQLPNGGWIIIEDDATALSDYLNLLQFLSPLNPKVIAWQRLDFDKQAALNAHQGKPDRLFKEAPAWLTPGFRQLLKHSMQHADYVSAAQLSAQHRKSFIGSAFTPADENYDTEKLKQQLEGCPNPEKLSMEERISLHHARNQFLYMTIRNNTLTNELNIIFVEPIMMADNAGVGQWLSTRNIPHIKLTLAGKNEHKNNQSYKWRRPSGKRQKRCWIGDTHEF